jgi:hypothetical protein
LIKLPWIDWILFSFCFMLIHYWTLPQQKCPDLRFWFLGTIRNFQNNTVYFSCKKNMFPYKMRKWRHLCTCTHIHSHILSCMCAYTQTNAPAVVQFMIHLSICIKAYIYTTNYL